MASFCAVCGRQFQTDAHFCASCGAAATSLPPVSAKPRLVRPRQPRMLAGVCSGVAIYYGWDIVLVRILYAVFCCLTLTTGALVYLVAWVLLPEAPYAVSGTRS